MLAVAAVRFAPARARLAAVATGSAAAAPPIPHIGMWGFSGPSTPDPTGVDSRASHALPPRTSAGLARNVASSLPRRPHTITEKFEQKVSAVERRHGVAGLSLPRLSRHRGPVARGANCSAVCNGPMQRVGTALRSGTLPEFPSPGTRCSRVATGVATMVRWSVPAFLLRTPGGTPPLRRMYAPNPATPFLKKLQAVQASLNRLTLSLKGRGLG
jgi:hypothetical protein